MNASFFGEQVVSHRGENTAHIATGGDANVADQCAAMLTSVVSNLRIGERAVFHIVETGLKATLEPMLLRWPSHRRKMAEFHWLSVGPDRLTNLPSRPSLPNAAFLRLLLPELLPADLCRVLWLDTDVLALRSVIELWNTDLDGKPLGAAAEFGGADLASVSGTRAGAERLGIHPEYAYLNSGVLLFDLRQWRQQSWADRVLKYTRENQDIIAFGDQDGINLILAGQWFALDPHWNVQTGALRMFERLGCVPDCNKEAYARRVELLSDPWIVHFAGDKPWIGGLRNPHRAKYFHYLGMSGAHSTAGMRLLRMRSYAAGLYFWASRRLRGR